MATGPGLALHYVPLLAIAVIGATVCGASNTNNVSGSCTNIASGSSREELYEMDYESSVVITKEAPDTRTCFRVLQFRL